MISGCSAVGSVLEWGSRGRKFESSHPDHKRTLILIQRLAFFLCPKSLAPQGFFHLAGCIGGAFPLFFGCKRRLMLVSPYSEGQVGCMIKRLPVVWTAISQVDTKNKPRRRIAQHYAALLRISNGVRPFFISMRW